MTAFSQKHPRPGRGFTLIEVMIVVALIGILLTLALPHYQEFVRRGHRAEARVGLQQAAHWLERAATASGSYPDDGGESAALPAALQTVPGGRYRIARDTPTRPDAFRLTATPQGGQAEDECGAYTLTHAGERGVAVGGQAGGEALATQCWER